MRVLTFALVLFLAACGGDRIVYVYADAGPQQGDGGGVFPDTLADTGAMQPDTWAADGVCMPDRDPGSVSSADCHRYPSTPVCDGTTSRCAPLPHAYCDVCETDQQCANGVDLHARCVYMHRDRFPSDQACLSPCAADSDCAFLGWVGVQCLPIGGQGLFCVVPFADGVATCSDFMGGRR